MIKKSSILFVHTSVNNWVKNAFEYSGYPVKRLSELKNNISICNDYDNIVFFDNSIDVDFCKTIRNSTKAHITIFYWNSINDNVFLFRALGVNVVTAFERSSVLTGVPYVEPIAICSMDFYMKKLTDEYIFENDFLFCGADKERANTIAEYVSIFNELNIYGEVHLVNYSSASAYNSCPEWNYEFYLSRVKKSKAILEVSYTGQEGPSQRLFEAVFLKRKLITDYHSIVESELYHPQNVFVLGEDNVLELPAFLESPFVEYDASLLQKYMFDNWVSEVTKIRDIRRNPFELGKMKYTCKVCGKREMFDAYNVCENMYGTRKQYIYFECSGCHCFQISEVPINLDSYYLNQNMYSDRPVMMLKPLKQLREEAILEVGCGNGLFLCELAENGYRQLVGCDPLIDEDILYSNGVRILKMDIDEMAKQGYEKFDQVWFRDSFARIPNPKEILKTAKEMIKVNGIIVLSIPVFPSFAFDNFHEYWYNLNAPGNILIHSVDSILYLAESVGLELLSIEYDSKMDQLIGSLFYQLGIPFRLHKAAEKIGLIRKSDYIELQENVKMINNQSQGDHALFVLQPK